VIRFGILGWSLKWCGQLRRRRQLYYGHTTGFDISPKAVQVVTEAALLGGVMAQGIGESLRILSDGAGQFNVLIHALCWVHAERVLRRLQGNTKQQRQNLAEMQHLLWQYYRQLQQ